MTSGSRGEVVSTRGRNRRQFLRTMGATGVAGLLVGCLGDGDDDGAEPTDTTDATGGEPDDTDDTDEDATNVAFEVAEFEPVEAEAQVEGSVTVTARIVNTAEDEGSRTVEYRIGDEVRADEDVTIAGFGEEELTFEVDLGELEDGEYTHGVYTDGDEATGTLVIEASPQLDASLIEPAGQEQPLVTGTGEYVIEAIVENPYLEDVVAYTVSLSVPEGWEIVGDAERSVEEIGSLGSESFEFEIDVPDGAEGEAYELGLTEEYDAGSAGSADSVESTWSIEIRSEASLDATWIELAEEASVQPETGITPTDVWGEPESDVSENSVSFAAWVRFDETHAQEEAPTGTIWYGYNPEEASGNERWEFNYDENGFGEVTLSNHGEPSKHWESDTQPSEGQWYHVVWVYPEAALVEDDENDVQVGVYINGSRDGEPETIDGDNEWENYPITGGDLPMQLGADPQLQEGRGFVGAIAHPTLWDGALTGDEIGAIAGDPGAIDDAGPEQIVRWDFADATDGGVDDQSGQDNHGELVGDYTLESGEISYFYES